MSFRKTIRVDDLLGKVAEILDIPDDLSERAVLEYEDVGAWLGAADSPLLQYSPEIYPQGSFRLGTVVRPLLDGDEYDIDLVCRLVIGKESTTQEQLKDMVGDRLKSRTDIAERLDERRRCWRIECPQQFHLDVLPVIPNEERKPTGILLTDTELVRWQKSNPIGYADWFYGRMATVFEEKRAAIAKALQANIEDVPDWRVRTPLQRVIQLLKRHRDVYFREDCDDKPVSIIITTLAGHAYQGQPDLGAALLDVLQRMPAFIKKRNDVWRVENPVDPGENFADKWEETPARRIKFFAWLQKAEEDFTEALGSPALAEAAARLGPTLGVSTIARAATSLGAGVGPLIGTKATQTPNAPGLGSTSHRQPPRWPVRPHFKIRLRGVVHASVHGPKRWELTDRPVPKNMGLRFEVETNAPRPFEVWWQVVNTGREASDAGQLRGGFVKGESGNPNVRWESTHYSGTHTIEAFVVKDGVCVARSAPKRVRIAR